MISSRRLAREWALKILYQMDVGGSSLSEARDSALERLRTEFVQRGSRNAIGSTVELICLESVTFSLSNALLEARRPFERAVTSSLDIAFADVPCWQEAYFERAYKTRFKGHKLQPARLLACADPEPRRSAEQALANDETVLTASEAARVAEFSKDMRETLPLLLAPEMRRTAREAVLKLQAELPNPITVWDLAAERQLLDARIKHNSNAVERWRRVAQIVQKQNKDWLRIGSFTVRLVNLLDQRRREVDQILSDLASGWKLDRQVAVDRNILRLAALEMLFIADIPLTASINEAVELAKKFSTNESGRFVNGVLGAIALRVGDKPAARNTIDEPGDDLIEDMPDRSDLIELDDLDPVISTAESVCPDLLARTIDNPDEAI